MAAQGTAFTSPAASPGSGVPGLSRAFGPSAFYSTAGPSAPARPQRQGAPPDSPLLSSLMPVSTCKGPPAIPPPAGAAGAGAGAAADTSKESRASVAAAAVTVAARSFFQLPPLQQHQQQQQNWVPASPGGTLAPILPLQRQWSDAASVPLLLQRQWIDSEPPLVEGVDDTLAALNTPLFRCSGWGRPR